MGLLNSTAQQYYEGNDFGNYQFKRYYKSIYADLRWRR